MISIWEASGGIREATSALMPTAAATSPTSFAQVQGHLPARGRDELALVVEERDQALVSDAVRVLPQRLNPRPL